MKLVGKTREEVDQEKYRKDLELCQIMRRRAYKEESDGLFFEWQQGSGTREAWLSKIAEIKARYPKPKGRKE